MKRARPNSPISEGTVTRLLDEDYVSDGFISDVESVESEDESSSDLFGDDTDEDPDYLPHDVSPTNSQVRPRVTPSQGIGQQSSDSSDDELHVPQNRPRPRGRPRNIPDQPSGSDSDSEDGTGWIDIDEETDQGHPLDFSFNELPGIKHAPPRNSPPITYFQLFFTTALLQTFVKYTNQYADNCLSNNQNRLKPNSRAKKWQPVTLLEIQAFIAVLINMGIKRQPTIYSYWWTSSTQYIPYFSRMFNRNRFQAILQFFHMIDVTNIPKPGQPNYNPCARFQPLIEHVNRLFKHYYTPGKNISIDESIIASKAHTQLRQYMPKKHHRWGIKLWMICDAVTHYCFNFFVYEGSKGSDKEIVSKKGLGFYVVVKLLEMGNLLNKGYHIFIDNFFTSLKLAKYLLTKCTALTGTIRFNRKGIPQDLKNKFAVGETKYKRKKHMIMVGFREKKSQKKQVLLLSTHAKAGSERRTKRRGTTMVISNKPKIIRDYNDYMGGVDGNDQMLCAYMDDRRTIKYWKKVTFSIFGRIVLNSYILYKSNTDKPLIRLDYTVRLVEALSKEWLMLKEGRTFSPGAAVGGGGDATSSSPKSFFEKLPNKREKNCCVCSKSSTQQGGKRKKSTFVCKKCQRGVHPLCYPLHTC